MSSEQCPSQYTDVFPGMVIYLITIRWWDRLIFLVGIFILVTKYLYPDSKVHVAHMGPTWVLSAPGRPHVGPTNLAIRVCLAVLRMWDTGHRIFEYRASEIRSSSRCQVSNWEQFHYDGVLTSCSTHPNQNTMTTYKVWFQKRIIECPISNILLTSQSSPTQWHNTCVHWRLQLTLCIMQHEDNCLFAARQLWYTSLSL